MFLLSGLWHGASWNFIIWGGFHGFFLIADRIFLLNFYKAIGRIPSIIITYSIVVIGWVYFRTSDLAAANAIIKKMFSFDFSSNQNIYALNDFYVIMVLAFVLSFAGIFAKYISFQQNLFNNSFTTKKTVALGICCYALLVICVSAVIGSNFNPFIYYKF